MTKNYNDRPYWEQEQDDITIIFLDADEYREELKDIEAIEAELQIKIN